VFLLSLKTATAASELCHENRCHVLESLALLRFGGEQSIIEIHFFIALDARNGEGERLVSHIENLRGLTTHLLSPYHQADGHHRIRILQG
jgi:hypothetical protein